MRFGPMLAALVAAAIAGGAEAHEFEVGDLTIGHPYALETAASARTAAGYFSVHNAGSEPDRLLAVRADFPRVELHRTEVDAQGVNRMAPVEALEIGPGETVTLAPRGMHVMFMGLEAPLAAGQEIEATLVFERAGEVAVRFDVERRGDAGEGHEGMSH